MSSPRIALVTFLRAENGQYGPLAKLVQSCQEKATTAQIPSPLAQEHEWFIYIPRWNGHAEKKSFNQRENAE